MDGHEGKVEFALFYFLFYKLLGKSGVSGFYQPQSVIDSIVYLGGLVLQDKTLKFVIDQDVSSLNLLSNHKN